MALLRTSPKDTTKNNSSKNTTDSHKSVKMMNNKTQTASPYTDVKARYRSLILSTALFLGLMGILLVYNFHTSSILQRNTALINASNQVANSSQTVIKDIFDLQNSRGEDVSSPHMKTVLARLKNNSAFIKQALTALENGGSIADAQGHTLNIPAITDSKIIPSLKYTQSQWAQLEPKVNDYLKVADNIQADSATALSMAAEQAKTSSLAMNDSLQALTDSIYENAEKDANTIRLIQAIGLAAILVYFIILFFFIIRRLRQSDEQTFIAQQEIQEIMANVGTGLFLLDKDLNIGNQYSAEMSKIFGNMQIAGQNLTKILKNKVSDKDLETTEGFINQLYNPRVKEKLVEDLNPLKKVMIQDDTSKRAGQSKYLDFKFSRVYHQDTIARILVNVQDVTNQVRLEQRLEDERSQNDLQIEMLTTILNVSPKIINEFIGNTKENITRINDILKTSGSSQSELEDKLARIYRIMHNLKGEASTLNLHSFTSIAASFEEKLRALQTQGKLSGNDFLPLTIHLDELLNLSNTIEALGDRINQSPANISSEFLDTMSINLSDAESETLPPLSADKTMPNAQHSLYKIKSPIQPTQTSASAKNHFKESPPVINPIIQSAVYDSNIDSSTSGSILPSQAITDMNEFYEQFAHTIAERQDKQVTLKATGFDEIKLSHQAEIIIKEIVIQLIRNAVVHGIEMPDIRLKHGKGELGHIDLSLTELAETYKLSIEDDGQGIDYEAIRSQAVKMGYAQNDVDNWSKQKLTSLLFKSGFSTKEQSDEDAGRGVGMDIIKDHIQSLQGHLSVDTKQGLSTRFTIKIPKHLITK